MKRVSEQGLAAWAEQREKKNSRVLQPAFWGTVSEVQGSAGNRQVQVVQTGQTTSDGQWHFVQVTGQVPTVGDVAQLQWQDDNVAVVTSLLSTTRVADQHSEKVRLGWTGSFTCPTNAWSWIGYNTPVAADDPGGLAKNTGYVTTRIAGWYWVTTQVAVDGPNWIAAAIYINGVETRSTHLESGAATVPAASTGLSSIFHLGGGYTIKTFIFNTTPAVALSSNAARNFLDVHLLSAD